MLQFLQRVIFSLFLFVFAKGVQSATFTLVNKCSYTIWPATLTSAGITPLPATATGFSLSPSDSTTLTVPATWSGRMWARTHCSTGPAGNFSCATGDCGTNTVQCSGNGAAPPATLAEFTLKGADGLDFYDVSLVDGYNLPLIVRPMHGSGNCTAASCIVDLNESCPNQLKVVASGGAYGSNSDGVACKSACEAFGDPQYCCSGSYATPDTCKPSEYSKYFKNACPTAYSYAYDDATSTFTCAGADYVITFCPKPTATGKLGTPSPTSSQDFSASKLLIPPSIAVLLIVILCALLFNQ